MPREMLRISFDDGSTWVTPHHDWQTSLEWKIGRGVTDELAARIRSEVDRHWASRTWPTPFGFVAKWSDGGRRFARTYETKAELAGDVIYSMIRDALLALSMADPDSEGPGVFSPDAKDDILYYDPSKVRRAVCAACCKCQACEEARKEDGIECICGRSKR